MAKINFKVGNTWIDIVDIIYPVGSVYLSYNSTSPNEVFPNPNNVIRNWTQVSGKYLYTGDNSVAGTSDFKITSSMLPKHTHGIGGSTGSESSHTHGIGHTHTAQFVSICGKSTSSAWNWQQQTSWNYISNTSSQYAYDWYGAGTLTTATISTNTSGKGSGHSHSLPANTGDGNFSNNVYKPYYQSLYCWYRIADTAS